MIFFTIDGRTPSQLHEVIEQCPHGFSVEGDSVCYLGRELLLHDGKAILAEKSLGRRKAGDMLDRLVLLRPDLRSHLPDSTAQAISNAAMALVQAHGSEALRFAPTQSLRHAVALEYIGRDFHRINDIAELAEFSARDKYLLIQAAQRNCDYACNYTNCRWLSDLTREDKFALVIDSLKRPEPHAGPGHLMFDIYHLKTAIDVVASPAGEFEGQAILKTVRDQTDQIINSLALPIMDATNFLETEFLKNHGYLVIFNAAERFPSKINNLLYLIAACRYVPEQHGISELKLYLKTILDNQHYNFCQWFARDIVWLVNNAGTRAEFTRFFDGVASITDHANENLRYEEAVNSIIRNLQPLTQTLVVRLNAGRKFQLFQSAFTEFIAALPPLYRQAFTQIMSSMEVELTLGLENDNGKTVRVECSERLSRLFFLVRLCSRFAEPCIDPEPYFKAIIACRERENLYNLVNALTCLLRCDHKTQDIFSPSDINGGELPLLAMLVLAPLRQKQLLSDSELNAVCDRLNGSVANRKQLKNVVVFNQWLVTTNKMYLFPFSTGVSVGQILLGLTQNMANIVVRLGFIGAALQIATDKGASEEGIDILKRLGLDQCLADDTLVQVLEHVADGFVRHPSPVRQWLWQQRYPHLLPVYINIIMSSRLAKEEIAELMGLIDLFITSSTLGQFIVTRHDTRNNPHLTEVYRQRPDLASGWLANFDNFSEGITSQLPDGYTLTITEDPWDLFVSGFEVKSCLSPASPSRTGLNRSLMSYVMDGRNAMLVEKNSKGNIVRRAVIRLALAGQPLKPVMVMEKLYGSRKFEYTTLFDTAAQQIAFKLNLPVYRAACSTSRSPEQLTMLRGRAPFDYFDSACGTVTRQKLTIDAVPLIPLMSSMEIASTWL